MVVLQGREGPQHPVTSCELRMGGEYGLGQYLKTQILRTADLNSEAAGLGQQHGLSGMVNLLYCTV